MTLTCRALGAQGLPDAMAAEAVRRGAMQLELPVAADNARAIRIYDRNGFACLGTQPRAIIVDTVAQDDFFLVRVPDL